MREMKRKKKCHEKLIRLCCWIIRHLEFSFLFFVNLSMIPFFSYHQPKENCFVFFFSYYFFFFLPLFSSCFFFLNEFLLVKFQLCKRGGKKPWEETRTSWASEIFFLLRQKCSSTKEEIPNRLQMRNSISAPTHYRQKEEEEEKRVFFLVLLSALLLSIEQLSKWDPTAQIVRRPHRHSIQMGYVQYISTYPTAFVESFKRTTN